jgi:hypothetical protein
MATHDALWPDNINTAHTLWIEQPCKVTDAYYLFTDRPNIKTIKVAGMPYSRQELSNMEPHAQLGRGQSTAHERLNELMRGPEPATANANPEIAVTIDWETLGEPPPTPTQPAQTIQNIQLHPYQITTFEAWTNRPPATAVEHNPTAYERLLMEQYEAMRRAARPTLAEANNLAAIQHRVVRREIHTSPEYERAMENLLRDNPSYRQYGDVDAIADGYWVL